MLASLNTSLNSRTTQVLFESNTYLMTILVRNVTIILVLGFKQTENK